MHYNSKKCIKLICENQWNYHTEGLLNESTSIAIRLFFAKQAITKTLQTLKLYQIGTENKKTANSKIDLKSWHFYLPKLYFVRPLSHREIKMKNP